VTEPNCKKKTWLNRIPTFIAITTLLLAACATLTSFKAGGYGNRMVLAQSQASDQWAFYQAKSIKETQYQIQRAALAALVASEIRTEAVNKQLADFDKEISRYKQEKDDIAKEAKKLEAERDSARQYNSVYGQALMFLQVGILLSSLASINKVYGYWYAGTISGVIGIGLFLYAMIIL
jgi:septal ring factor EnvC (AmiA/AmiB activator)